MTRSARRLLLVLFVLAPPSAAVTADSSEARFGSAGMLMLRPLPPCLEQDFSTASDRCLPPRAHPDAPASERHDAFLVRAKVLIYLRRSEEALQDLDGAIAVMPTSVDALHLASRLAITDFKTLNQPLLLTAAQSYIARAVELAPRNADVQATNAFIIQSKGIREAAIAAYGVAIALQPNHAFALARRAFLHSANGHLSEALKDYDRAVATTPDDVALRYARAKLLVELDRPRDALGDLNVAIERDKHAFPIYVMRAGVHKRLGNSEAALEDLNSLIYGPKGGMPFATGGDQLAGFIMQRALMLSDLGRSSEAASDMLNAIRLGGKQKILRLQVYLRQHGHEVPINGAESDALKAAIDSCFRQDQCRRGIGQRT